MKLLQIEKILIFWTLVIFMAVAWPLPENTIVSQISYSDKIVHVILFGLFASLLCGALIKHNSVKHYYFVSWIGAAGYAAVAELIQVFIPGRTCSVYDFLAGSLGALVFLLVFYVYHKKR